HHGGQPAHAGAAARLRVGQKKHAVDHARNGVQLGVQVPEGTALAGDVDQVGGAAVQQKFMFAGHFDDIAQGSQLLDVAALREYLTIAGNQLHVRPQTPRQACGRASGGDLAGFGGTVDLE